MSIQFPTRDTSAAVHNRAKPRFAKTLTKAGRYKRKLLRPSHERIPKRPFRRRAQLTDSSG